MQFSVERDAFVQELARVTGVIERKTTLPILAHVRLDAGARGIMLRATDMEIQAETVCRAEVAIQGVTTVDGQLLHDAVKRAPTGCTVSMTLDPARGRMKLVSGRSRFEMLTLDAENFPMDLRCGDGQAFTMDAGALRELIEATRFAVCTDESLAPVLHGVYVHQMEDRMVAVACERPRMSCKSIALPEGANGIPGVSMPRKLMKELMRCLPEKGPVQMEISASRIVVSYGDYRLVSNLLAGTFPDYQRIIPQSAHAIVVDRKRLMEGLDRVSLALDEKSMAMQMDIQADGIRLGCQSGARGTAWDEIEATIDGPAITVSFNHRYLRECMDALTGDRVVLAYQDHRQGIMIRAEHDEEMTHRMVVMPMQVPVIQEERMAA